MATTPMSTSTFARTTLRRRALIIGWDTLRPNMITSEITPVLRRLAEQGVQTARHYAPYPTETRVNAASLSTGCWAGRHGIVGNEFYMPGVGPEHINTGNHGHLFALEATGESIQLAASMAQRLASQGLGMAVVSAGTPGVTLMWDPTRVGPVLDVWADFGDPRTLTIRRALAPPQARQTPNTPANRYAARVVTEHFLSREDLSVCVLWCNEPDHSQHHCSLGSPEATQALRDNDALLEEILLAIERRKGHGQN